MSAPSDVDARPEEQLRLTTDAIDAVDTEIIGLIEYRNELAEGIQRARSAAGGCRTDLGRENAVLNHYRDRLGAMGTTVALTLIKASRGYT